MQLLLPPTLQTRPPYLDPVQHKHDKVIVCVSAGKDSVVLLLMALLIYGRPRVIAHHCIIEEDWEGTVEYLQWLCHLLGVPLYSSRARYWGYECLTCGHRYLRQRPLQICTRCKSPQGRHIATAENLLDLVEWRGKWPDRRVRFCTDFLKTTVLNMWAEEHREWLGSHPLVLLGERWAESDQRSKLPEVRKRPSRAWLTEFRPLLRLRRREVYRIIREAGIALHYCYDLQWFLSLQEEHRRWRALGIHPLTSYPGQWDDLNQVETIPETEVLSMIDHLKYEVDEEGGPRMSCVVCFFKSPLSLGVTAQVPEAQRHFERASTIETHTHHTIKKGTPLQEILARVPSTIRVPTAFTRGIWSETGQQSPYPSNPKKEYL